MRLYTFHQLNYYLTKNYVHGLVELLTYNSIPNVDEGCNNFDIKDFVMAIPTGSYKNGRYCKSH